MAPLRRLLAVLLSLVLVGCAAKPAQRDKGLVRATSTLDALREVRVPRRYAVLIGVNQTDDPAFPELRHAVADASALGEVLASGDRGRFDKVVVLGDRRSTQRDAVLDQLRWLRDTARRDDVVVVYFSGHGTRLRDGDRWRRFLVTSDAAARDLEGSAIDLAHLQQFFGELAPTRKALIVDACFNGDGKSRVRPADREGSAEGPITPSMTSMGAGEAHLFATSAGRPSREDDELGHGVYTWFLLDALSWSADLADVNRDGAVTAWEAHDWARGRTVDRTDGVQLPEAMIHLLGSTDIALVGGDEALERSDDALVYLYPQVDDPLHGASLMIDGRDKGELPRVVPVSPGRHHVVVRRADGEIAVDGMLQIQPDRAYTVEEVQRLAQGPAGSVGWGVATMTSPPLSRAIGGAALGPEVSLVKRDNQGTGRGFTRSAHLGLGISPARRDSTGLVRVPRPVVQVSGDLGYQGDVRRFRGRAGWGLTGVWIPRNWVEERPEAPDPLEHLSSAGWVFGATGPTMHAGVVLGGGWSAGVDMRAHAALLSPVGDGVVLVPWVTTGLGLEVVR